MKAIPSFSFDTSFYRKLTDQVLANAFTGHQVKPWYVRLFKLVEHEFDAVLRFFTTRAVDGDDVCQPLEDSRP